jgi:hypothetical protein
MERCEFCWTGYAVRMVTDPEYGRNYRACLTCAASHGDEEAERQMMDRINQLLDTYAPLEEA